PQATPVAHATPVAQAVPAAQPQATPFAQPQATQTAQAPVALVDQKAAPKERFDDKVYSTIGKGNTQKPAIQSVAITSTVPANSNTANTSGKSSSTSTSVKRTGKGVTVYINNTTNAYSSPYQAAPAAKLAQVDTNTAAIADHNTRISGNTAALKNHEGRISSNTATLKDHEGRISSNTATLKNHEGRIQNLETQNNQRFGALKNQVEQNRKEASAGIAGVAAMANIPQVSQGAQMSVGAGAGTFNGEQAVAVGASARLGTSVVTKFSVSTDTQHNFAAGAGVSYEW
ncbi:TPA: YadA-like family protein, partial [Klebsiella variicola subsp. variicola]|nr:YadA-like family protein [Klebsiella variicola subsp. variicola]